ncbi:MAG: MOSC N-terminal beta barrel domain-containing protein [Tychonema bourrellyi B0820]|uniref:MOSC domain-containing protein n=1 Tax=Tychonema bourrellyi FEM_GT703 TaxID=2040638 RepID=A0A2G4EZW0_9CYAN|nr:MOSC N-terminal beta barrel domain-containing protein [Tychonema bourrellyi]MDQ2096653.1 MOSC N-terminal beta barrel domain-containing protein [Tychonema bourrellyi B0820]PHX55046.1 MOSC domain-containing protein [Tychonema bourrellyi FEM_GT703]
MAYVASIHIYPVKSLDGISVSQATILASGALKGDRSFAICDDQGEFVSSQRHNGTCFLRLSFNVSNNIVGLKIQGTEQENFFHIDRERARIESWLTSYFGFPIKLVENLITGFSDNIAALGPTIISTETIAEIASWFPRVCVNEMRQHLRANIEIGDVPPFWEDQLFAASDEVVRLQIGKVTFEATHPSQCIVSTRNSFREEVYPNFQEVFTAKRNKIMPHSARRSPLSHLSQLNINTRVLDRTSEKIIQIGDEVKIISIKSIADSRL